MVKKLIVILIIISTGSTYAQKENFVRKGLLRATSTLSPGKLLVPIDYNCVLCLIDGPVNKSNIVFLNGELEYWVEDKISIRGEFYHALSKPTFIATNSHIFFGGLYHFSRKKLDINLGLQPGVTFSQPSIFYYNGYFTTLKVLPSMSVLAGLNYYIHDYFHFFGNFRYVKTTYFSYESPLKLDQIVFSAGLGFQLHTRKK